jgi:hypothetical protein
MTYALIKEIMLKAADRMPAEACPREAAFKSKLR